MPCNSVAEYGYCFSEMVLFASIFSPYRYRVTVKKKRLNTTNTKRRKKNQERLLIQDLNWGLFVVFDPKQYAVARILSF